MTDDRPGARQQQGSPGAEAFARLVERARAGDAAALDALVRGVQDRVYGLALRMLWHPADAEDATQEILIRVVTHLATFRGESAFTTWVYRIAANYLLTTRRRRLERQELTFSRFAEDLDAGLTADVPAPATEVEEQLLVNEVKIGCTQGMLLCLDREHRIAFILGEVFELPGPEAASILGISPAAFRKRLSRARTRLYTFLRSRCGIVNPDNACRCERRIGYAVRAGRVDPDALLFATHPAVEAPDATILQATAEMTELHRAAALMRSHPRYAAPEAVARELRRLLSGGQYRVFDPDVSGPRAGPGCRSRPHPRS